MNLSTFLLSRLPSPSALLATGVLLGAPALAGSLAYAGNAGGPGVTLLGVSQPNGIEAHPSVENPLIQGHNLYAPDLVRNGGVWNLYYGGWKNSSDVNDRIYFAVSDDLLFEGPWSGQSVIISNGGYLHVNDPSVQKRPDGRWVMAYTVAHQVGSDYRDWIAISTSTDGAAWTPSVATSTTEVRITNASFSDIARPALLWTGSGWKLWFDARTDNGPLHSYLAESSEDLPRNFVLVQSYPDVNGFPGFMEPDVERVNGRYVAVVQRGFATLHKLESTDGRAFTEVGTFLSAASPAFGRKYVSNPGLVYDNVEGTVKGVGFGMTNSDGLTEHDIGFAYTQYRVSVLSCPSTWHAYTTGRYFDQAQQLTFGYGSFCRIRVEDPRTGQVLADQAVGSVAGDRWQFVP
ncbi:arabinan endo-1,5-alpha-L-arabinosidase [Corallococcus llansteffanensis]|uniref:Beta-xylosidase n=1 Tax=Corallococcus llansteffanensis TaxID=2316731 RepID=A0A3A8QID3_9BACT|nr:arabinan endo-1,5-alpha-L-arabinosidase [Corallococcus llansteffanensis]RKH62934.1 hypothetical protein D7V93_09325 [Corallococcus llansteffanensis]